MYKDIEEKCYAHMQKVCDEHPDPSHDILHVNRVVALAKRLAEQEGADLNIVVPAAYLHDCIYISKADSRRSQASTLSAEKAVELLKDWNYPEKYHPAISHAVAAHSFSANIKAESLEAQIVQDADRLDAMGAIGLFRAFAFSGLAGRPLYDEQEPFAKNRELNDKTNALDHFYIKLLKLKDRLHTGAAKKESSLRQKVLQAYVDDLKRELSLG